jgi:hypothetical protein
MKTDILLKFLATMGILGIFVGVVGGIAFQSIQIMVIGMTFWGAGLCGLWLVFIWGN